MRKSSLESKLSSESAISYIQQFLIQSPLPQITNNYPSCEHQINQLEFSNLKSSANHNTNYDLFHNLSEISQPNQKNSHLSRKGISKRRKNHNACKKVNRFAFCCLQSLTNCRSILNLKKFIHRYDFFLVMLLVSNSRGVIGKFSQIYDCKPREYLRYREKFEKDLISPWVQQFFQKTKKSIGQFIRGDINQAINVLYDAENLRCKAYLVQAQARMKQLYELVDGVGIEKGYSQKRLMKKTNSQSI